jgi:hypothetical protein
MREFPKQESRHPTMLRAFCEPANVIQRWVDRAQRSDLALD